MATLYVENVPDDLYEALRKRAKSQRRSIASEVITLLQEFYPTEKELKRRQEFLGKLKRFRAKVARTPGNFPTAEQMIREDRER
jgi:plasmid stability protein